MTDDVVMGPGASDAPSLAQQLLNLGRIDYILECVGERYVPKDIDRGLLAKDLADAVQLFALIRASDKVEKHTKKAWSDRTKTLEILDAARTLNKALNGGYGDVLPDAMSAWFPLGENGPFLGRSTRYGFKSQSNEDPLPSWSSLRLGIAELEKLLEIEVAMFETAKAAKPDAFRSATLKAIDLAEFLIPNFETHFGRRAAISRDAKTGKLGGPLMRFACAVTEGFSVPINHRPIPIEPFAAETLGARLRAALKKHSISPRK